MASSQFLACPVRACALPLEPAAGGLVCPTGHRFDRARGGSYNLLQPNQRRSALPGDRPQAVQARERLALAGIDVALIEALVACAEEPSEATLGGLLDVGCGVGTLLAALEPAGFAQRFGIDLSADAVRTAARRNPGATALVANADYRLPFLDGRLDLVLSIKAPRPWAEFERVLGPGGRLLIGLPTPDDLAELRSATAGGALPRDPLRAALAEVPPGLVPRHAFEVRERRQLEGNLLQDLLASAYRGQRRRESERAAQLDSLEVTLGTQVLVFERT